MEIAKSTDLEKMRAAKEKLEQEKKTLLDQVDQLEKEKRDLMLTVTDIYEQNLESNKRITVIMIAVTELFEQLLELQSEVMPNEFNGTNLLLTN
ncbi:hypothetical protein [Brevibacillus laterosporus]|uniref:hypothetical protein n=1 Tax=Brevibacillus laterosporus TaxID=1465 RepID=UPI001F48CE66|nr:hypothetical protein [Brevibacillus laterosporus]